MHRVTRRPPMLASGLQFVSLCCCWYCFCCCFGTALGKIPPTLPVCSANEEMKVAECQRKLSDSLMKSLPVNRVFFTGQMQPTELSRVCQLINGFSACDANSLGFCRRLRPTQPPTDYLTVSLSNFCYNGAFNDYPTLFLCYQSAGRRTTRCHAEFEASLRNSGLQHANRSGWLASSPRRDTYCGLYRRLVDCASTAIRELCGSQADKLVEPLLEISVPNSAYCSANKFMRYILSIQADQLVATRDDSAKRSDTVNSAAASVSATAAGLSGRIALSALAPILWIPQLLATIAFANMLPLLG